MTKYTKLILSLSITYILTLTPNCFGSNNTNTILPTYSKIFGNYELLIDSSNTKTFNDITINNSVFINLQNSVKITQPHITYWLKFDIKNNSQQNLIIEVMREFDVIELYIPDANGTYIKENFDTFSSLFYRKYFYFNPTFNIPNTTHPSTYYLKLKTNFVTGLGFIIYNSTTFYNYAIFKTLEMIVFVSILFLLLGYNLVLGLRLRDSIYLYYSSFIFCLLTFSLVLFGLIHPVFKYIEFSYIFLTIPYMGMTLSILIYSLKFLDITSNNQRLYYLIVAAILIRLLCFFIAIIGKINYLHDPAVDIILLSVSIIAAVIRQSQGFKLANYLLASLTLIFCSYIFHFLVNKQLIVINKVLQEDSIVLFVVFSIAELMLFSFTLSERYVLLKKEKEFNQQKVIDYQSELLIKANENELLQKNLNNELEKLVSERTSELQKTHHKLLQQAKEIEEMNVLLKVDNEKLYHDVENLNKARLLDSNLTYQEFHENFPNEETISKLIADLKWKDGYRCNKCNFNKFYFHNNSLSRKCRLCGYVESPFINTLLENVKFPIEKALYLIYLNHSSKKLNISQIAYKLELNAYTCSNFLKKIKSILAQSEKYDTWISSIYIKRNSK